MGEVGAPRYGRVPARVVLRGGTDGWHCETVDEKGGTEAERLGGPGLVWDSGPEPRWWTARLTELALAARERTQTRLTDRTFLDLGVEADITWFAVEEPLSWEGLVTLREPDPARFPGRVPPYVVTLEPGRGALLPEADLLFTTLAHDAWGTLDTVAARLGTAPSDRFICGYTGCRTLSIGRGTLAVASGTDPSGVERVRSVVGERRDGWGGNPELRLRLDGIDLLDEPAADVVTLLRDLGHRVAERHGRTVLPELGLRLGRTGDGGRFEQASLELSTPYERLWKAAERLL